MTKTIKKIIKDIMEEEVEVIFIMTSNFIKSKSEKHRLL